MKKQEFLNELKRYLLVLQDEEQDDILQEYEQHIEMKIESGQSEEDVIRDFGSIRELAGEILEAYHVKLNDQEPPESPRRKKERKKIQTEQFAAGISFIKVHMAKSGKRLVNGLSGCCSFLGRPFRILGRGLSQTKRKLQEKPRIQLQKNAKQQTKKGVIFPMFIGAIKSICRGIAGSICWGGRMIWNCAVVCAAAFSACLGLICLYLFGVLVILWRQGYPLGGIVLGSFGAVLCFMSLAVFGSTFYRKKRWLTENSRSVSASFGEPTEGQNREEMKEEGKH